MKTIKMKYKYLLFYPVLLLFSCGREFLDIRRDSNQVVPSTIHDYQSILDNNSVMNITSFGLVSLGADEHSADDATLAALTGNNRWQQNGYTWAQDVYEGQEVSDWNMAYERILYANLALDVEKITPLTNKEKIAKDLVRGQALFHRAWNFYQLAQAFCKPYEIETANTDMGIPLRIDYDVSIYTDRATVKRVYDQILTDLYTAELLLPINPIHKFQPSKVAVQALLARVLLHIGNYNQALQYASSALRLSDGLLDFDGLDTGLNYSFENYPYGSDNPEVIFHCHNNSVTLLVNSRLNVAPDLYELYDNHDLRRPLYFSRNDGGRISFKGSYRGSGTYFTGLAVDELHLIQAECFAYLNELESSASALNELLMHRYMRDHFVPVVFEDQATAMTTIMQERRKELYLRGIRWDDLRRWNIKEQAATTLVRYVSGQRYELPPNDLRLVWPFPDNEVKIGGLVQNPR